MRIDIISDTHFNKGMLIEEEVERLLPQTKTGPAEVLILAGDISNYINLSVEAIQHFAKFYQKIFLVFGNHDLYMNHREMTMFNDFYFKWSMLERKIKEFSWSDKVEFLNGNVVEYKGVRFGGSGGWCDMTYAKELNISTEEALDVYHHNLWDSYKIPKVKTETLEIAAREYGKLELINQEVDIMVTHYAPDTQFVEEKYKNDPLSAGFYFNGIPLLESTSAKIWIHGHTHQNYDKKVKYNGNEVRVINNACGFEDEGLRQKVKTVVFKK